MLKMKKSLIIIVISLFAILMIACSGGNSELNERNTELAEIIVSTADLYLDGEIDAWPAIDIIDRARNDIVENDPNSTARVLLSTNASRIAARIANHSVYNEGQREDILSSRNSIAESAGLSSR